MSWALKEMLGSVGREKCSPGQGVSLDHGPKRQVCGKLRSQPLWGGDKEQALRLRMQKWRLHFSLDVLLSKVTMGKKNLGTPF